VEGEEEKRRFITHYFSSLFRSNGVLDSQQVTQVVERKVTAAMNDHCRSGIWSRH
jgi:hypothetical protein